MEKGTQGAFFLFWRSFIDRTNPVEVTLNSRRIGNYSHVKWLRWVVLLIAIVACYAPGLSGSFVFDDEVNILQNQHLRITSLQWRDLWAAALSGNAGPFGRPVALVTFALNLFLWGVDPYYFKLVNLSIHLVNAILIGALTQSICAAPRFRGLPRKEDNAIYEWSGWMVAALWALHPINLTSVLYVVQRMTSLSAFFGFCALLTFVKFRQKTCESTELKNPGLSAAFIAAMVLVLLGLSLLAKESGLLFVPLLLWIEYIAYRFRYNGKPLLLLRLEVRSVVTIVVLLACAYAAVFKIPAMIAPSAFSNRDFDVSERVLTEMRVVLYYLRLILFPKNSDLSLYHDDFVISRSLWDPIETFFSTAALLGASVASLALRRRFPALLFAWGWFLIAHALESTVFALELVHEHRNYFATVGLFVLLPLSLVRVTNYRLRRLLVVLFVGYLGLLGFITHVRALQWSNTVDWAALEASNHPASARANYELARNYMILRHNSGDDRFGELADEALIRSTESYLPGVLPYMARIHLAYFRGIKPDPAVVEKAKFGLRNWPFYTLNTATLDSFVTCQIEQNCHMPDDEAVKILEAALENPLIPTDAAAEVKKLLAQYYINRYNDLKKGVDLIEQAIRISDQASSRIMYAQALAMQGKFRNALEQLDVAELRDNGGLYRLQIRRERSNVEQAAQHQ